ncbi:hypothetical protein AGDE_12972 [Angomonas deanei]|uniref:Uncharacterized protein n=1 Tax=Angomonas deanei TaxID=59799 RepID=A0A7G2CCC9_9TRYP|nr:hypothetical protein AGDE_12972 [Angomonas deanei]CAD2216574.1 hypothetical protein, conserved [Angomonas deanei]|eukprot:EPY23156.1 hypothetical protein AGDE_12972 [Angomonas deanei]
MSLSEVDRYHVWCEHIQTIFAGQHYSDRAYRTLTDTTAYPTTSLTAEYWEIIEGKRQRVPFPPAELSVKESSSSSDTSLDDALFPHCFYNRMLYCSAHRKGQSSTDRRAHEENIEQKETQLAAEHLQRVVAQNRQKKTARRREDGPQGHAPLPSSARVPYIDVTLEKQQNELYTEVCQLVLSLREENKMREEVKQSLLLSRTLQLRHRTLFPNDGEESSTTSKTEEEEEETYEDDFEDE